MLYLVVIGWFYVVILMAVAEAQTSLLGALFTLLLYGALPLAVVIYIFGAPLRRRARRSRAASGTQPDGGGHATADTVAPEREET